MSGAFGLKEAAGQGRQAAWAADNTGAGKSAWTVAEPYLGGGVEIAERVGRLRARACWDVALYGDVANQSTSFERAKSRDCVAETEEVI